jgi:hypothetical protein
MLFHVYLIPMRREEAENFARLTQRDEKTFSSRIFDDNLSFHTIKLEQPEILLLLLLEKDFNEVGFSHSKLSLMESFLFT